MALGKESIDLTTFGRYRFRRMPFSLKIVHDVFQTKMDQTFEDVKAMHAMLKRFLDTAPKLNPTIAL